MNKEFYHRQIQLWGEKIQQNLKDKKVAIIGCGGLGCSLGYALGSSGIGEFFLIDFDKVELHNIHRQIAFFKEDIGEYKCEVLKKHLEDRSLDVDFKSYPITFEEFTKKNIAVDLIIDATDNFTTREKIDIYAKSINIPWLYGSVEEFNGQVCLFDKSSFSTFNIIDKKPAGITAPIVMLIASLQANIALRFLAGLKVKSDILHYLFFNQEGEFITQQFKLPR